MENREGGAVVVDGADQPVFHRCFVPIAKLKQRYHHIAAIVSADYADGQMPIIIIHIPGGATMAYPCSIKDVFRHAGTEQKKKPARTEQTKPAGHLCSGSDTTAAARSKENLMY